MVEKKYGTRPWADVLAEVVKIVLGVEVTIEDATQEEETK